MDIRNKLSRYVGGAIRKLDKQADARCSYQLHLGLTNCMDTRLRAVPRAAVLTLLLEEKLRNE